MRRPTPAPHQRTKDRCSLLHRIGNALTSGHISKVSVSGVMRPASRLQCLHPRLAASPGQRNHPWYPHIAFPRIDVADTTSAGSSAAARRGLAARARQAARAVALTSRGFRRRRSIPPDSLVPSRIGRGGVGRLDVFGRGGAVEGEDAVEVVDLVLQDAGIEPGRLDARLRPLGRQVFDPDRTRADHPDAVLEEAQAAFPGRLGLGRGPDDPRVDRAPRSARAGGPGRGGSGTTRRGSGGPRPRPGAPPARPRRHPPGSRTCRASATGPTPRPVRRRSSGRARALRMGSPSWTIGRIMERGPRRRPARSLTSGLGREEDDLDPARGSRGCSRPGPGGPGRRSRRRRPCGCRTSRPCRSRAGRRGTCGRRRPAPGSGSAPGRGRGRRR